MALLIGAFIISLITISTANLLTANTANTANSNKNFVGMEKLGAAADNETFRVLITHPEIPKIAIELLEQRGLEVVQVESMPPAREEILRKIKDCDAALWAGHEALNAEVLAGAGSKLRVISTLSAGYDFVDVPVLRAHNVRLGNTPTVLNDAVAELAVGLLVAAARRFQEGRLQIERAAWDTHSHKWLLGQDIRDSTVGFFGFGQIGQAIASRLKGFDIERILYTTRKRVASDIETEYTATHVPFERLVSESDHLIIAAPLTNETRGVFNASAFERMKSTAVLVNIARGPIVNQKDLYVALKNKRIFAAGLDVMTPEPLPPTDPLLQLSNCVVIPHLGSATERTRSRMAEIAALNIVMGLDNRPMFHEVLPAAPIKAK